jgi:PPOX class probable FMN-dependent enzyme
MLPDRRGNNRLDALRNIVRDPRVALLFLVPGIGRTLRVNGTASITTDPALCASFAIEGKTPRSVVVVTAKRVYTQCAKALVRSRLWDPASHVPESALPSSGEMLRALSAGFDAEGYDRDYPRRLRETIY